MQETRISNFFELHEKVQSYDSRFAVFRGVERSEYKLIPTIGRIQVSEGKELKQIETYIFRTFKERAIPFLDYAPKNDWEWLAIAQHHGLPTRLLDWTRNILVAAFFAVQNECDTDSAIYVLANESFSYGPHLCKGPINLDVCSNGEAIRYIPTHVTSRIVAQSGLFTLHTTPELPLENANIEKLIIPNQYRYELKKELYKYGVNISSLFPSLDGLAKHITWMNSKCH